jgi:hypothetical protein
MHDLSFLALLLFAGMTFPLAFWMARLCLAGVIRVLERPPRADAPLLNPHHRL